MDVIEEKVERDASGKVYLVRTTREEIDENTLYETKKVIEQKISELNSELAKYNQLLNKLKK